MKVSGLKKGQVVDMDNDLWQVVEMVHNTPGNLRSNFQIKFKSLSKGNVIQKRLRPDEDVTFAYLDTVDMQYIYPDGDNFVFMNTKTFDQIPISKSVIGDSMGYIKAETIVRISFYDENPVTVELPTSVELAVTKTEPAARGDTVSNVQKPATMETGLEIQIPSHINEGDIVKVDTRTGEFLGRVNQK
ncbi:MAG: elongation factor P [Planctomycetota bacterium]